MFYKKMLLPILLFVTAGSQAMHYEKYKRAAEFEQAQRNKGPLKRAVQNISKLFKDAAQNPKFLTTKKYLPVYIYVAVMIALCIFIKHMGRQTHELEEQTKLLIIQTENLKQKTARANSWKSWFFDKASDTAEEAAIKSILNRLVLLPDILKPYVIFRCYIWVQEQKKALEKKYPLTQEKPTANSAPCKNK